MNIKSFSKDYKVKCLNSEDVELIYELCCGNPLYYEYCPPMVTKKSILEDLVALPQNVSIENKYYIGFFDNEKLIAVMDLIDEYPEKEVCYIGFFMTDKSIHNNGIGSKIISDLVNRIRDYNIKSIQLAWIKGNPQSEHFWLKNNFVPVKETFSTAADCVILAERKL